MKLRITLVKSWIHSLPEQVETVKALGLNKTHGEVIHEDTPAIRGMIAHVAHLVKVEEVKEEK